MDDPFQELRGDEDRFDVIHEASVADGALVRYAASALSEEARYEEKFEEKRTREELQDVPDPADPRSKVHPLLVRWMEERDPDEVETLVVAFRDEFPIPRFPEPDVDQPRECHDNQRQLERADALVDAIWEARADDYERLEGRLEEYRGEVTERFWLIRGLQVRMPLGAVERLIEDEEVLYVQPDQSEDEPPQNDVVDGRRDMVSDPYFNLNLTSGWIGLLDTGLRRTHVLFNSPSHVDFMRDCVNGGADCNTGPNLNPNDDCWNHGTSSAAIITANGRQGDAFRGVTGIALDSWKVYPTSA